MIGPEYRSGRMTLLAALSQTMTQTQKQLVGFVIVGGLVLLGARHAWKNGNKVAVVACAAVVLFLARGIGQGGAP